MFYILPPFVKKKLHMGKVKNQSQLIIRYTLHVKTTSEQGLRERINDLTVFCTLQFLNDPDACNIAKKKFLTFYWTYLRRCGESSLLRALLQAEKKKKTIIFPSVVGVIFYSDVHSKTLLFLSWSDSFTAYTVVGGQCLFLLFVFSSSLRLHACW